MDLMADDALRLTLAALREHGLLLLTDARLPSVASIVAGEPVRGSWWGHPLGHVIFEVANALESHAEVGDARLLSGKVTYVHSRFWPALVALGAAHEQWQMAHLSQLATQILNIVLRDGAAQTDDLDELGATSRKTLGNAARELESAVLVHGNSIHTDAGSHAKHLERWEQWADRRGMHSPLPSVAEARNELEHAATEIGDRVGAIIQLPWMRRRKHPAQA